MSKLKKYDKEWLEELCKDSYSYSEVLKKAGRKLAGGNNSYLKKKIEEYQIDVSHFLGKSWSRGKTKENNTGLWKNSKSKEKYQIEEIFKKNSPVSRRTIREYVKRHHLLEYKCQFCGCDGHWQNGIITLEIDHIDGDSTNHELKNLRYLCPNCHALTETYAGKNNKNN